MKNNIFEKVHSTIEKYNMTNKSEHLLVGLSGGADSVALLLCLYKLGFDVEAVHINHHLRGDESDRDMNFCVDLCERMNIKITVKHINVTDYCQKNSVSTEEGARILRYNAFNEIKADKICTAHNLNDCFETTIFNLARGSGLKGICSIPPCRDNIIRPLIECTRGEIEEYLSQINQPFVTDSTNLEDEYSRNKIRHQIIPTLEKINPSLLKTYGNTLDYLREDNIYLEKSADKAFELAKKDNGYSCDKIDGLDYSIRRRVIMRIIEKENLNLSSDKIKDIENLIKFGGKVNVKQNTFAVSNGDFLEFVYQNQMQEKDYTPIEILKIGEYEWCGRKITFEIIKNDSKIENVHRMFANCCLDYDKIKGKVVLGARAENDTIKLCNRDFTSNLRKLLKKNFPLNLRDSVVLLRDDEGVFFVEKCGPADRVKIDEDTQHILTLKIS